jgi:hypothetical protein
MAKTPAEIELEHARERAAGEAAELAEMLNDQCGVSAKGNATTW